MKTSENFTKQILPGNKQNSSRIMNFTHDQACMKIFVSPFAGHQLMDLNTIILVEYLVSRKRQIETDNQF